EGVKKDLKYYKVTKKPLNVIANGNVNGIDTNFFNPTSVSDNQEKDLKTQLNILETDFVFIFVGRLVADKGINELIEAFKEVYKENKNCKLLLVGPFENELDPLNANTLLEIKNNSSIVSVGFQNDVKLYLSIANVFVFPSYREGFPNVVLQAGAMNLPCIVTNISGSNEIITDEINGLIVPTKNAYAISYAMKELMNDENLLLQMKEKARNNIVAKYNQNIVWNAILSEYKKASND
ncbi:glycosyltransferase, partial [Flavobacterium sp.]|uniref:glycosyltransferase n=1 Tax=Flavobacterium sp. TaxID=239 RepID=UPI0037521B4C